ncbi:hypothetical protein [Sandarakinorhabdus sp.]|uniref:hypothetical protein n=1 Tax=Sandarakinorhabdus sp. TaxID=1916663 RepID=UPI003F70369E
MTSKIDPATAPLPIDAADWAEDLTSQVVPSRRGSGSGRNALADFARSRLVGLVEDARDTLVGQVRSLKSIADQITDTIGGSLGDTGEPFTRMIGNATGAIDNVADALAEKSVEELVEEGRELVRAQPVVAVGLAIAIGFLAGRFMKAAQD